MATRDGSSQMVERRRKELSDAGITSFDPEILQSHFLFKRFMRTHHALKSSYGSSINLKKNAILENLNNNIELLNKLKFEYNAGASFSSVDIFGLRQLDTKKPGTKKLGTKKPDTKDEEVSKLIVASNIVDEIKLDLEEMIIIRVIENEQERCVTRTRVNTHNKRAMTSKSAPQAMTSNSASQGIGGGKGTRRGGGGGKGTRRVRWRRKRGGVSRKV